MNPKFDAKNWTFAQLREGAVNELALRFALSHCTNFVEADSELLQNQPSFEACENCSAHAPSLECTECGLQHSDVSTCVICSSRHADFLVQRTASRARFKALDSEVLGRISAQWPELNAVCRQYETLGLEALRNPFLSRQPQQKVDE